MHISIKSALAIRIEPPVGKREAFVLLFSCLASGGLALTQASTAYHFVLRRVVAKGTLDGIARPLGIVPQGNDLLSRREYEPAGLSLDLLRKKMRAREKGTITFWSSLTI